MKRLIFLICLFISFNIYSQESNPYVELRKETYQIQSDYLKAIASHQEYVMLDLEKKLNQQIWQTVAIAVMVFLMVGLGLYLSYMQFKRDSKEGTKSSVELSIGAGSIKINSTVIGLVILALSFWFFQTYIDKAYSIKIKEIPTMDFTTFGVNH